MKVVGGVSTSKFLDIVDGLRLAAAIVSAAQLK